MSSESALVFWCLCSQVCLLTLHWCTVFCLRRVLTPPFWVMRYSISKVTTSPFPCIHSFGRPQQLSCAPLSCSHVRPLPIGRDQVLRQPQVKPSTVRFIEFLMWKVLVDDVTWLILQPLYANPFSCFCWAPLQKHCLWKLLKAYSRELV